MSRITSELALGMSLALEASGTDLLRALSLLEDRADPAESRAAAIQLLLAVTRRVETVKNALDDASQLIAW
jgi:hypothetical protein